MTYCHIVTVIWFLGYRQYTDIRIPHPEIYNVSIKIPKIQKPAITSLQDTRIACIWIVKVGSGNFATINTKIWQDACDIIKNWGQLEFFEEN